MQQLLEFRNGFLVRLRHRLVFRMALAILGQERHDKTRLLLLGLRVVLGADLDAGKPSGVDARLEFAFGLSFNIVTFTNANRHDSPGLNVG